MILAIATMTGLSALCWRRAERALEVERWMEVAGRAHPGPHPEGSLSARVKGLLSSGFAHERLLPPVLAAVAGWLGLSIAGWPVGAVALFAGLMSPRLLRHRRGLRLAEALERQLAELVESCALAVRGGSSVAQALEAASREAEAPMAELLRRLAAEQRLGLTFDGALASLVSAIGTEDVRLFALVMGIHHRSGGNVAGALEEVGSTIRHRIRVRRELRALTAQGRISGAVLGTLPVGFFLVLAATSHHDLAPVYRTPAGIAMIVSGLVLEAVAFLWIRRLLKVEM